MKALTKTFYILFVILLVAIAGLFVVSLLPIPGNIEIKIVKSGSMEPFIKTGSIVIVKPEQSYKVGDVVTFGEDTQRQIPTTHRIVSAREENGHTIFSTKGDANEEADPNEVGAEFVIGKVVTSVPYAGYLLDFARKPVGFILLIAVPAAFIILDESIRIGKEIIALRRKRRNNEYEVS
jgi:signal peptidase